MINGLIFSLMLFTNGEPHVAYPDLSKQQCEQLQKQLEPARVECVFVAVGI